MRAGGGGGAWEGPPGAGLPRRPQTLPPGLARVGARPGDRAARRGTQGAGAGLHSGPVSSAVPEAPGLTHRTAHTQTRAAHHVRRPTRQTRTAPHPASPTRPPAARAARVSATVARVAARRTPGRQPGVHTHCTRSTPEPAVHSGNPSLSRSSRLHKYLLAHAHPAAHTRSPALTPSPPVHTQQPPPPLPAAAPRGAGGVGGAAPFPRRANKRLLLPARPKKGRLSGVRGGRGGPTLWPCPTWRPRAGQAEGQRGAAPWRPSHPPATSQSGAFQHPHTPHPP